MQDTLSNFNPLDGIEKPISYKLVAAVSISLFVHGGFLVFKDIKAQSKPATLPLHIVITNIRPLDLKPELIIEEIVKPVQPVKPEPPEKTIPVKKTVREPVKQPKKKKQKRPVEKIIPTIPVIPRIKIPVPPVVTSTIAEKKAAPALPVVVRKVSYLHNPPPKYPQRARRMGLEGDLLLRVRVLETGIAEELFIKESSGSSILDKAALKAVRNWHFIPAQKNNQSISTWVDIPIRFKLDA
ncbi:MAG: TonB family protein [Gammaproteobacteria bacterium]